MIFFDADRIERNSNDERINMNSREGRERGISSYHFAYMWRKPVMTACEEEMMFFKTYDCCMMEDAGGTVVTKTGEVSFTSYYYYFY